MIKLNSIFISILLAFTLQASTPDIIATYFYKNPFSGDINFYEEEVRNRLENMECLVTPRIDEDVMDQVKRFVSRDKINSLEILKRTQSYFPLIDKIFTEYGLPVELKYITVVESALQLDVKSRVGAVGIWQFMPATARLLKLTINEKTDQRMDPVLSTHAAAKYFKILYNMFGDWSLAIAAYNCGENKLKDLLDNSRTKDFWDIKKSLPRQTQLFIPAFIGVSYMMQYYAEHDIVAELDLQNSEKLTFVKVHKEVNLKDLFKKTKIKKDIFNSLNPSYKKLIIPAYSTGAFISLPDSLMIEFVDYYTSKNNKHKVLDEARIFVSGSLSDLEIISFNRPHIFAPDNIASQQMDNIHLEFEMQRTQGLRALPNLNTINENDFTFHIVKSRESISEIAFNYQVDIDAIIEWNQLDTNLKLKPGAVLKVLK